MKTIKQLFVMEMIKFIGIIVVVTGGVIFFIDRYSHSRNKIKVNPKYRRHGNRNKKIG